MEKAVLLISTLDTKALETLYLRDKLKELGVHPVLMDISMRSHSGSEADISPKVIAEAAGSSIEEIHSSSQRAKITNLVVQGACKVAIRKLKEAELKGVIAVGGSTGSLMSTEVMRSLPFGIPKVMVSSTAALPGLSTRYIGTGDIFLFHSVVEISGLSNILKNVLDRAALALSGMVHGQMTLPGTEKEKAVALTMLGPCEKCASAVRKRLEEKGYQVIGFSAAGVGDKAMEDMIDQDLFHCVADLAPGGVGEHIFGFMRDAGPNRLETAGEKGLPQVVSTCSVNHMTPAKSKYKPEYHQRRKYDLDKYRTWIRLSPQELKDVAAVFAKKLNKSRGQVKVVIPGQGWSSVDAPGNSTYDPEEDLVFVQELRGLLNPNIEVTEVPYNMEDPEFAEVIVQKSLEIF